MIRNLSYLGAILVVGLSVGIWTWKRHQDAGPRAFFPETVFVGDAVDGKLEHVFEIRNLGSADLLVDKITPSCGCTAPAVQQLRVGPGETGRLPVVMTTVPLRRQSTIYLQTNDQNSPNAILTIKSRPANLLDLEFVPSMRTIRLRRGESRHVASMIKLTEWDASATGDWQFTLSSSSDDVRVSQTKSNQATANITVWSNNPSEESAAKGETDGKSKHIPIDVYLSGESKSSVEEFTVSAKVKQGTREGTAIGLFSVEYLD